MSNFPVTKIILHCSDSPQGRGDDASTIHKWHLDRGWHGCGYHWIILENGTIQAGRPEYWMGSHCSGHNSGSIGVCLIGEDKFPEEQMGALRELVISLMNRHKEAAVYGHNDFNPHKTCPNFDVYGFMQDLYH